MAYEVQLVVTVGYSPLATSPEEIAKQLEGLTPHIKEALKPVVGCWNGGGVKDVKILKELKSDKEEKDEKNLDS